MLRTIWAGLLVVAATIPFSLMTLAVAAIRSNARLIDGIIRLWARICVRAAGIDLHAEGTEVIDRQQRYILIANHSSYVDIPCIFAAIPQPIRFMAKISLFKIPIFGWAIGRAGFIPIDRKNRRTAVKSFELAVDRIRKGNTVVVFPKRDARASAPCVPSSAADSCWPFAPVCRFFRWPLLERTTSFAPAPSASRPAR